MRGKNILPSRGLFSLGARDNPGSKIRRGKAAACGCNIILSVERLIENLDASRHHPRLGCEISTRKNTTQVMELRQNQRAGTLGADQLACRIELEFCHELWVVYDLPCLIATSNDDRIRRAGFAQRWNSAAAEGGRRE